MTSFLPQPRARPHLKPTPPVTGRYCQKQTRRHDQPDQKVNAHLIKPEGDNESVAHRTYCLTLKAQPDAGHKQQAQNAPAHHAQPSWRNACTSFQILVI